MSGNVYEWCEDIYAPYDDAKQINPRGPKDNRSEGKRVCRGGSWDSPEDLCKTTSRNALNRDDRLRDVGFRLVYNPSGVAPKSITLPPSPKEQSLYNEKNATKTDWSTLWSWIMIFVAIIIVCFIFS